ncbi:MAG TPA: PQQ-binding-like beta-propeller repeat protein [Ktedonobacteraceae bacterium]|nr:PQQ-binding-like beta-propeller repeat protein [Ktedonobacteraceae bacterium]
MAIRFSHKGWVAGLCLLLMLALTLGLFQPRQVAHAKGASITLTPNAGLPTSTVLVKGAQFGNQEKVTLRFDSTPVGHAITSSTGRFSTTITVPQMARLGYHKVTALGQISGLIASARFQLLPADWTAFGFGPTHSHFNPYENQLSSSTVSHLTQAWSFPAASDFDSSPAVVGGVMYLVAGSLFAIDAASGTQLWKLDVEDGFQGSPAVANGMVYIGGSSTDLYAVDAATGTIVWTYGLDGYLGPDPVVANGMVYMGAYGNDIPPFVALDALTGQERWTFPIDGDYSTAAVAKGVVYVADGSGKLFALDAVTGIKRWSTKAIDGVPSVVAGVVYISGSTGYLEALDARTGTQLWKFVPKLNGIAASPAVANGVVYINADQLYALDARTGSQLWSFPKTGSSPAVANGVVYMGSDQLYALDATTGTQLWSYPIDSTYSPPVVVNGMVYAADRAGKTYAFRVPTAVPPLN